MFFSGFHYEDFSNPSCTPRLCSFPALTTFYTCLCPHPALWASLEYNKPYQISLGFHWFCSSPQGVGDEMSTLPRKSCEGSYFTRETQSRCLEENVRFQSVIVEGPEIQAVRYDIDQILGITFDGSHEALKKPLFGYEDEPGTKRIVGFKCPVAFEWPQNKGWNADERQRQRIHLHRRILTLGAGPEGLDSLTVGLQTNSWRLEFGQSNSTPQPREGGWAGQLSN